MLIRYGGLVANYHHGFTPNSRLVVWLSGMPNIPSQMSDSDVTHFLAAGYDVVFPEYYGFGRSDGEFTPDNCLQTLVDTYSFFIQGGEIQDIWTKEVYQFPLYQEIVVVGASFGAAFAARIGAIDINIASIGLLYPAIEYHNMNKLGFMEEDFIETSRILQQGGYKHMYRSAIGGSRDSFYQDQRGQSYHEMISHLSQKSVFIVHGGEDDCVHVSRSRHLYQELQSLNPGGNHCYLEIPTGGHGRMTRQIGAVEMCKWLHTITQ